MCKISPVTKQFLTIVCCNLLTFSFGMASGWSTINFNELQSGNSTLPTGPLNLEEASLVVSLINVGGFAGNWITLPMSHIFGIKRTIHLFGVPLIVSHFSSWMFHVTLLTGTLNLTFFLSSWVQYSSFGHKMYTIYTLRVFYRVLLAAGYLLALPHWYKTYRMTGEIKMKQANLIETKN